MFLNRECGRSVPCRSKLLQPRWQAAKLYPTSYILCGDIASLNASADLKFARACY